MGKIDTYTNQIAQAVYGEEVRSSIINALNVVNDDNESYQSIKTEIINAKDDIDEQVENFDTKVANAKTAYNNLVSATTTANTAKTNLTNATTTANTAKTNLTNATTTANTAKSNLETATTNANNAIANATTAKTNLETTTSTANTAKSNLETAIANATTAKTNLETTTSTANTAKSNLETAIANATTAKNQLQVVIDNADSIKSSLSTVITEADIAKNNLDASVASANTAQQSLSAENASAKTSLNELRSENFNSQEILAGVADLRAYLGLTADDILGLQVDYKNKTFKRLAGAVGLTQGADFDKFSMFGGRKRCNVSDDGTITAYYGDSNYKEDGSNGQVMVYQPKFYYLVCPVEYDPIDTGIGYHLRKANYYVSEKARTGFRLHPAFYDASGNEVDYVLIGAYEGSIYDSSASAYLTNDEQVMDASADKFSSVANVRPASGLTQNLTRPNIEQMSKNRGDTWHSEFVQITSMNQLLMIIEAGTMNTQTAYGNGAVSITNDSTQSCASYTGGTASLGNASGQSSSTKDYSGTAQTASGKVSLSYRGVENPWGNIWKLVYGLNMWGDGSMGGGEPYYCTDLNFAESKHNDNYEGAGFTVCNASGWINAMGYSTSCDWMFIPSEIGGNSALPVGDCTYITTNLNGYRIPLLGAGWTGGSSAGGFCWSLDSGVGSRGRAVGGRLVYIPNAVA